MEPVKSENTLESKMNDHDLSDSSPRKRDYCTPLIKRLDRLAERGMPPSQSMQVHFEYCSACKAYWNWKTNPDASYS